MTPTLTAADLLAAFQRLGIRPGDSLLVHASLSRFGHVDGGAPAVIDSLRAAIGPAGTLLMSAITTNAPYVTTCIAAAEKNLPAPVPPFDVAGAKTYAGAIAETFRNQPGVLRSWHPTHSVTALGPRATELLADHHLAPGPCGEATPYTRLCSLHRGFILLLGVNHMANTTLHGFEELARCDYVLCPHLVRIPLLTPAGPAEARTRVHYAFMRRNLGILETDYLDGGAQTVTRAGNSTLRLAHAPTLRDITVAALQKDPHKLLTPQGAQAWALMQQSGNFTRDPSLPTPNS